MDKEPEQNQTCMKLELLDLLNLNPIPKSLSVPDISVTIRDTPHTYSLVSLLPGMTEDETILSDSDSEEEIEIEEEVEEEIEIEEEEEDGDEVNDEKLEVKEEELEEEALEEEEELDEYKIEDVASLSEEFQGQHIEEEFADHKIEDEMSSTDEYDEILINEEIIPEEDLNESVEDEGIEEEAIYEEPEAVDIEEVQEQLEDTVEDVEEVEAELEEELEVEEADEIIQDKTDEGSEIIEPIQDDLIEEPDEKLDELPMITEKPLKSKTKKFKTIKIIKKIKKRVKKIKKEVSELPIIEKEVLEDDDQSLTSETKKPQTRTAEEIKRIDYLIKLLNEATEELREAKLRNKKLLVYIFALRKKAVVTSSANEVKVTNELIERYIKRLEICSDTREYVHKEIKRMRDEIQLIKDEYKVLDRAYTKELSELLQMEVDVGKRSVDSHGRNLNSATVDALVKKHHNLMNQLHETKLEMSLTKAIKDIKEEKIKKLSHFGGTYSLFQYDQLQVNTTNFKEKLEERDIEMGRLNNCVLQNFLKLAHVREVTDVTQNFLEEQREQLKVLSLQNLRLRSYVIEKKTERDRLRESTVQLKNKGGMLFYPKLNTDYKETVTKINEKKAELENLMKRHETGKKLIEKLQRSVNFTDSHMMFLN